MGGWWRKEVKTLADLKGVKMRIAGLGGTVFSELGVVPQQIAGGDIYPALEKGTIDAAEWVGPYDDEKLGFYKVAKNYYYPGFWESGPIIHFFVNKKEWDKLPKEYQAAFQAAAYEANVTMMAEYDHKNPIALSKLLQNGVKLQSFSDEILGAAYKATSRSTPTSRPRTRPSRRSTPSGKSTARRRTPGSAWPKCAWTASCRRTSKQSVQPGFRPPKNPREVSRVFCCCLCLSFPAGYAASRRSSRESACAG